MGRAGETLGRAVLGRTPREGTGRVSHKRQEESVPGWAARQEQRQGPGQSMSGKIPRGTVGLIGSMTQAEGGPAVKITEGHTEVSEHGNK